MENEFTPEKEAELKKALAETLEKTKLYCNSLVGKTRSEATKMNMDNGFHTDTYHTGDFVTYEYVPNRIRIFIDENNIVTSAFKG